VTARPHPAPRGRAGRRPAAANNERAIVDDLTYALALERADASFDPPVGGTAYLVRDVRRRRGAADRLVDADWDVLEGPVGAIVQAAVAREVAAAGEDYPPPARVAYVTSLAALEQARERLRAGQGQDGADAAAGGAPETGGFAKLAPARPARPGRRAGS
jgi:hypothetical protein